MTPEKFSKLQMDVQILEDTVERQSEHIARLEYSVRCLLEASIWHDHRIANIGQTLIQNEIHNLS